MTIRWQLIPALAMVALVACSGGKKEEKSGSRKQTFNPVASVIAPQKNASGSEAARMLKVVLTPGHPKTGDKIQAFLQNVTGSPSFVWEVNGETVTGQAGGVLPAGTARKGDQVTVHVKDGNQVTSANVTIADSPPKVLSLEFQDAHIQRGQDIEILPQAMDPDGDNVSFHFLWMVNGEDQDNDSSILPGDAFHKGDKIVVQVTPDDGETQGAVFRSVAFTVPDAPPVFDTTPPHQFMGREYSYAAHATDPDGDNVTYALEAAPNGMTINPHSGQVRWSITNEAAGTHRIKITASDPDGMKGLQAYDLTLSVPK